MDRENRIYGLDVVRATAILLVVVAHVIGIDPQLRRMPEIQSFGVIGVEIFFVLSGYLIGGIIIRLMYRKRFNTARDLVHFWLNRWFRTLPVYYLFFLIYCFFHGNFFWQLYQHASYAFFLQNLAWRIPIDFFGQSWSLSIEEWFYLVFPLFLFCLYAVAKLPMRTSILITAGFFLVASLALRIANGPEAEFTAFDQVIRKWVIFRFDALMFGVLAAYLKNERPDIWNRIAARSGLAFAFLSVICLFTVFGTRLLFVLPWLQMIIFPVISLAVACALPFFAKWKQSESIVRQPVVGLAKSSYSIYLSHPIPVTALDKVPFLHNNYLIAYPLAIVAIFALGAFSYCVIEAPLMDLRKKWNDRFQANRHREA